MNKALVKPRITRDTVIQYALITLGALVYALGQLFFIKPLHIPMGGINGISLVLNYAFSLPAGATALVLNIPLYFMGWRTIGRRFFYKTVYANVWTSIFMDALAGVVPGYSGEMLVAALYGGVVMGAGAGLIFRAGGTTGGTDIIAKWLYKKRDIAVGTTGFDINIFIIIASAFVYGNPDGALYALLTSFLNNQVIDRMVYGVDIQKKATIITNKPKEVSEAIMQQLGHGVTAMDAVGMYTGDQRTVLICAVRRHETSILKRIVMEQDQHAFMLLSEINEVFGQGFKNLGQ